MLKKSGVPRLVLHVGIHKTATSTLQTALRSLRPQLRAHGVAFINHKQVKKLPHVRAWAARLTADPLKAPRFMAELRSLVEEEVGHVQRVTGRPARCVLVSSEQMVGARMPCEVDFPVFRPLAEVGIAQILDALGASDAHVALYTRRQDTLMESAYMWEIQKGLGHTIHEQFPFMFEPVMDYSQLADRIAGISGIGSLRVRPFESISAGSLAYLDDFLSNVDLAGSLDYSVFEASPSANRSYSQKALDIALIINPYLDTAKQRAGAKRMLKGLFPVGEYPHAVILEDLDREKVLAAYRDANERLFSKWMPDLPAGTYSTIEATRKLPTVPFGSRTA